MPWTDVMARYGHESFTQLGLVAGRALESLRVRHPFYDRDVPLILGDHVTLEAGTGCVHTAPGHGRDALDRDHLPHGWPPVMPLFRPARPNPAWWNLTKTLAHAVVLWTTCLALVPAIIFKVEAGWGVPHFSIPLQTWLPWLFFAAAKLDTTDGCRFDFEDGWLHLRTSNTEPVMRAIVEARDRDAARGYLDTVSKIRMKVLG